MQDTHSISAGLDYPGVGPEHAYLKETGRATYVNATDAQALEAIHRVPREAKESFRRSKARTRSRSRTNRPAERGPDDLILVNLSGRGDKDLAQVRTFLGIADA